MGSELNVRRLEKRGSRIRERLDNELRTASQRGITANDQGILRIATRTIEEYIGENGDRYESLRRYVFAAMGPTWREEKEVIRDTARYLGFKRTGPIITETLKSTIRSALLRKELERNESQLRRVR